MLREVIRSSGIAAFGGNPFADTLDKREGTVKGKDSRSVQDQVAALSLQKAQGRRRDAPSVLRWPSSSLLGSRAEADSDHIHELLVVGGFLEKCGGAGPQRPFFVGLRIAGAQHDDRNIRKGVDVLQAVQNNKSVADGQAKIKNNQRRTFFLG